MFNHLSSGDLIGLGFLWMGFGCLFSYLSIAFFSKRIDKDIGRHCWKKLNSFGATDQVRFRTYIDNIDTNLWKSRLFGKNSVLGALLSAASGPISPLVIKASYERDVKIVRTDILALNF